MLSRSTRRNPALITAGSLPTELEARLHLALGTFESKTSPMSISGPMKMGSVKAQQNEAGPW